MVLIIKVAALIHISSPRLKQDHVEDKLEEAHDHVESCDGSEQGVSSVVFVHVARDISIGNKLQEPHKRTKRVNIPVKVLEISHRGELPHSEGNGDVGQMLVVDAFGLVAASGALIDT